MNGTVAIIAQIIGILAILIACAAGYQLSKGFFKLKR